MNDQIKRLKQIIDGHDNLVFFGGAGVSTESGIPDFRSESGIFSAQQDYGYPPETLLSATFFRMNPEAFFEYHKGTIVREGALPNAAHIALARLEEEGKLRAVVTQNIDGLHQRAGSKTVHELHGSIHRNHCVDCGARYSLEYCLSAENCRPQARGGVPLCAKCGGIVRPDVVLYEEGLDSRVVEASVAAIEAADVLIVGGTSLVVYPAAGLLRYFRGSELVLVNKGETAYDDRAGLVIRAPIGEVFAQIRA